MTSRKRNTFLGSMYDKHCTIMRLKWLCNEFGLKLDDAVPNQPHVDGTTTIRPYLSLTWPVAAEGVSHVQLPQDLSVEDEQRSRTELAKRLQDVAPGVSACFVTSITIRHGEQKFIVRADTSFQHQPWFDFVRAAFGPDHFACRVLALCKLEHGRQSKVYAFVQKFTSHHGSSAYPDLRWREPTIKLPLVSPDRNLDSRFDLLDADSIIGPLWVTAASTTALQGAYWVLTH